MTGQVIWVAQLLLAYGADPELVEEISQRPGYALGLASVEFFISSNSLVLTSLVHGLNEVIKRVYLIHPRSYPTRYLVPMIGYQTPFTETPNCCECTI